MCDVQTAIVCSYGSLLTGREAACRITGTYLRDFCSSIPKFGAVASCIWARMMAVDPEATGYVRSGHQSNRTAPSAAVVGRSCCSSTPCFRINPAKARQCTQCTQCPQESSAQIRRLVLWDKMDMIFRPQFAC